MRARSSRRSRARRRHPLAGADRLVRPARLFPLIAKWLLGWSSGAVYKGWKRPKRFDRNLIVIGAGAGGLVTAYIAATVRAKVTLIEAHKMGGDCLNTGCVPSKALIRSARLAHEMRTADDSGSSRASRASLPAVMERVRASSPDRAGRQRRALHQARRRRALGYARIVDPWTVEIDGAGAADRPLDRHRGRRRAVRAGHSRPEEAGYLTSDTMWDALRGATRCRGGS
jgi:hypothetical protein